MYTPTLTFTEAIWGFSVLIVIFILAFMATDLYVLAWGGLRGLEKKKRRGKRQNSASPRRSKTQHADRVFCTQCGAAYLPDTESCDFCGKTVFSASPPKPGSLGSLQPAFSFSEASDCWDVENILRGNGIPTFRQESEGGLESVYPGAAGMFNTITLSIPAQCMDRARGILGEYGYQKGEFWFTPKQS